MILFHTINGIISMIAGLAIIFLTKGTRLHKFLGRLYATSMIILCVASFAIKDTTPFFRGYGIFHLAALVSLGTLILGLIPAIYRRGFKDWYSTHYYFMLWSYVGLIMAFNSHFFRPTFLFIANLGISKGIAIFITMIILWMIPPIVGSILINRNAPLYKKKFSSNSSDANP